MKNLYFVPYLLLTYSPFQYFRTVLLTSGFFYFIDLITGIFEVSSSI